MEEKKGITIEFFSVASERADIQKGFRSLVCRCCVHRFLSVTGEKNCLEYVRIGDLGRPDKAINLTVQCGEYKNDND